MQPFSRWAWILIAVAAMLAATPSHGQVRPAGEAIPGRLRLAFGDGNRVYTLRQGANQLVKGVRFRGVSIQCSGGNVGVSGKLSGECRINGQLQGVQLSAQGPVRVKLSSEGGATRLEETVKLSGKASAGGRSARFTASGTGTARIFDGDTSVDLRINVRVCVEGTCLRDSSFVSVPLDPDDGLWDLDVDVTTSASGKLRGSAIANLYRKRLKYKVKGSRDPATGLAQLTLKARRQRKHNRIELRDVRATGGRVIGQMDYQLFGQSRQGAALSSPIAAGARPADLATSQPARSEPGNSAEDTPGLVDELPSWLLGTILNMVLDGEARPGRSQR